MELYNLSKLECEIIYEQILKGKYSVVENIGRSINSKYKEFDAFVAPDESYMIFFINMVL